MENAVETHPSTGKAPEESSDHRIPAPPVAICKVLKNKYMYWNLAAAVTRDRQDRLIVTVCVLHRFAALLLRTSIPFLVSGQQSRVTVEYRGASETGPLLPR